MDDLLTIVATLACEGIYEPGAYVKQHELGTTSPVRRPDGSLAFQVYTTRPNTDREEVTVTISLRPLTDPAT